MFKDDYEKAMEKIVPNEELKEKVKGFATNEDLKEKTKNFATNENVKEKTKSFATNEEVKAKRSNRVIYASLCGVVAALVGVTIFVVNTKKLENISNFNDNNEIYAENSSNTDNNNTENSSDTDNNNTENSSNTDNNNTENSSNIDNKVYAEINLNSISSITDEESLGDIGGAFMEIDQNSIKSFLPDTTFINMNLQRANAHYMNELNSNVFDILNQIELYYENENSMIKLEMSDTREPSFLECIQGPAKEYAESKINDNTVLLFNCDDIYGAKYSLNNVNYLVKSKGISEEEFVKLIANTMDSDISKVIEYEKNREKKYTVRWDDRYSKEELDKIMEENVLSKYMPKTLPNGFKFTNAISTENSLSINMEKGEEVIIVSIKNKNMEHDFDKRHIKVEEIDKYDINKYENIYDESIPEELRSTLADPIFDIDDITEETIRYRLDKGVEYEDYTFYSADFTVLVGDYTIDYYMTLHDPKVADIFNMVKSSI